MVLEVAAPVYRAVCSAKVLNGLYGGCEYVNYMNSRAALQGSQFVGLVDLIVDLPEAYIC